MAKSKAEFVIEGKTPKELIERLAVCLAEIRDARKVLRDRDAESDAILEALEPAIDALEGRHYMVYVNGWHALAIDPVGEQYDTDLIRLWEPDGVHWPEAEAGIDEAPSTLSIPGPSALSEIDEAS